MDTAIKHSQSPRFEHYDCSAGCPVEAALEQISGKWKSLIIYHLLGGTCDAAQPDQTIAGIRGREYCE